MPHQPELKAIDTNIGLQMTGRVTTVNATGIPDGVDAINAGWQLQLLNGSIQGTTLYQRIGQKIVMNKLFMRLLISSTCAGAQNNNAGMTRAMIVYDAQANGTAFSGTTLANAVLKTSAFVTSPQNLDNRERFRVLLDKTYYSGVQVFGATGIEGVTSDRLENNCKKWKGSLKLDTMYNAGNAGTIGDIQSGALYLLVGTSVTNSVAANTITQCASGYCRVRFYDA